jgi:GTPase
VSREEPVAVERSGFVALVGRPNAGKSTLLNRLVGEKVSIVSDKPQTTRHRVVGVRTDGGTQIVFVDTPGLHKPVTALGERLNATAGESLADVDVACVIVDATVPFGRGDRWVVERAPKGSVLLVNKVDRATRDAIAAHLEATAADPFAAWFCISARTGEGVDDLLAHLRERLPEGPAWYPEGMVTDLPDPFRVAELVREQLLGVLREELPYSVHTRVTDWDLPHIGVDILVERESQKGMVIGKGGRVLKEVGTRARAQLPEGTYLELRVRVLKDWQHRPELVDRVLAVDELDVDLD